MSIASGTRLGPYKILASIGIGGMGEVYRAEDTRLERTVAIKVLPAHLSADPERRQRFEREARTIASLNHPHICVLHDVGHAQISTPVPSPERERRVQPSEIDTAPSVAERKGQIEDRRAQIEGRDESAIFDSRFAIHYLVMEYLEGETLTARLAKGPLPLDQVLRYAIEISDALDKAHSKGITHRDLKPGNIMLTKSGSKLLDFGLAKLRQVAGGRSQVEGQEVSRLEGSEVDRLAAQQGQKVGQPVGQPNPPSVPTLRDSLTIHGTILGTLQYMAPEQAEGKSDEIDARTDIFAFGAVLYEMVTGSKAFEGKSQVSLMAAILEHDPAPLSALQPMTPPALDHVVKTCLAKDPDERWQTASDMTKQLKWIATANSKAGPAVGAMTRRALRDRLGWAVAALAVLLSVVFFGISYLYKPHVENRHVRFLVPQPDNATIVRGSGMAAANVAVSPDGNHLVFAAVTAEGKQSLWLREMDSLTAHPLPGTEAAFRPFWSPDSRFIGFFAQGKLKKVDVVGGRPETVCDADDPRGAAWSSTGVIVFAPRASSALNRVSATGGAVTPATRLDQSRLEDAHRSPQFFPDGRHFTYLLRSGKEENSGIYIGSLDQEEKTFLLKADSQVSYAPPGYLLYVRAGTLLAQRFDEKTLQLNGEPVRIAEEVSSDGGVGWASFSVSDNGLLAYQPGSGPGVTSQLMRFDRTGKKQETIGEACPCSNFDLAPDGKRVVIERRDFEGPAQAADIWMLELTRGTMSRFTFDSSWDQAPFWSPDGTRILFFSSRASLGDLYWKLSSGGGTDEAILKSYVRKWPDDWSQDGRFIAYESQNLKDKWDLDLLSLADRKSTALIHTPFNERQAQFSPDGKWMAYASDESGSYEVYVQTFPVSGAKWQISTKGGVEPRWRRDAKELFYLAPDRTLMAVPVETQAQNFIAGLPKALFRTVTPALQGSGASHRYVASADGQSFLVNTIVGNTASSPITVVLNWTAGLKK